MSRDEPTQVDTGVAAIATAARISEDMQVLVVGVGVGAAGRSLMLGEVTQIVNTLTSALQLLPRVLNRLAGEVHAVSDDPWLIRVRAGALTDYQARKAARQQANRAGAGLSDAAIDTANLAGLLIAVHDDLEAIAIPVAEPCRGGDEG